MIDQINLKASIITDDIRLRPEKSEVERLLGANGKIKTLTGWQPRYDLKQGIAETIAWFRKPENLIRYKADIYNL